MDIGHDNYDLFSPDDELSDDVIDEHVLLWRYSSDGHFEYIPVSRDNYRHSAWNKKSPINNIFSWGRIDTKNNIGSISVPSSYSPQSKFPISITRAHKMNLFNILKDKFPEISFYVFDSNTTSLPVDQYIEEHM